VRAHELGDHLQQRVRRRSARDVGNRTRSGPCISRPMLWSHVSGFRTVGFETRATLHRLGPFSRLIYLRGSNPGGRALDGALEPGGKELGGMEFTMASIVWAAVMPPILAIVRFSSSRQITSETLPSLPESADDVDGVPKQHVADLPRELGLDLDEPMSLRVFMRSATSGAAAARLRHFLVVVDLHDAVVHVSGRAGSRRSP